MAEVKIDLHTHSEGSYDGKEPVDLIVEHVEDIDLDGCAITDHDEIDDSLEAKQIAEKSDAIMIPGVEVSTKDGHLLAIGVTEKPEEGLSYKNTVEKVREIGGVAVAPHPFQKTRHGVSKSKIKDIDAIEAFNAWLFTGFQNRRAKKFADKNDYPKVAGSDAHSLGMVGRAYTQIQIEKPRSEIRSEDVVEALRNGDVTMEGRRAPIYRATYHYIKASIRKTMYYTSKGLEKINKQLKRYTLPLRKVKEMSLRDELKRLLKE